MISINGHRIEVGHFPDRTQMLMNIPMSEILNKEVSNSDAIRFTWRYESDEEMVTLLYLRRHIEEKLQYLYDRSFKYCLTMPYIPNARMDRTESIAECSTLKYFCEMINSMKFNSVNVFDPHSNVSVALLNNVMLITPGYEISNALKNIKRSQKGLDYEDIILYFPDEGAYKRYSKLFNGNFRSDALTEFMNNTFIYGAKKRDWKTGKISGLSIKDRDGNTLQDDALKGRTVLMIDDIVSYGGTLAYSVDSLKELGVENVYAYASHTENSVMDDEKGTLLKRFLDGSLKRLYTTDSIYTLPYDGNNPENIEKYKMIAYVYKWW